MPDIEVDKLAKSLRKSLRPGDRPSLLMTNLAVEYFSQTVPPSLGQVDMHFAASLTRKRRISPCTLMLAIVYVDRLRNYNPDYLHKVSSSDLFLVSMIVASKFINDEGEEDAIFNDQWATSAHMKTREVNKLERDFLAALDWQVFVSVQTLSRIVDRTESILAHNEGCKRGWYTYTDLEILCKFLKNYDVIVLVMDRLVKVAIICAVTYTAGILTLVASTSIVFRVINPFIMSTLQARLMTTPCASTNIPVLIPENVKNSALCMFVSLCNSDVPNCTFSSSSFELPMDCLKNEILSEEKCDLTKNSSNFVRKLDDRHVNLYEMSVFILNRMRFGGKVLFETRDRVVVDR